MRTSGALANADSRLPVILASYDVSHIHVILNHKGDNLLKTDKIALEYSDKVRTRGHCPMRPFALRPRVRKFWKKRLNAQNMP